MKQNKALINYYARLILKGNYQESDVPDNLLDSVKAAMEELKKTFEFSGITSCRFDSTGRHIN